MNIAKIKKSNSFRKDSKKLSAFTLLIILTIQLVFNLLLVNNFFPITEGWFQDYARYILNGKFIYKDFYCAVPPGYIWWMTLLCKLFNNSFLLLRLYGILERMLLISVVFCLLKKIYSNKITFFSLTIASIFYASTNADVFYGYYQSSLLFAVIALFFCVKMYENFEQNKILYTVFFGIFAGIAFLMKQNTGALLPIGIGLVYLALTYKRNYKKAFFNIIISFLIAVTILGIAAIYLANNGALQPFFEQVFGGVSSKGSLSSIFFSFVPRMINSNSVKIILLTIMTYFINNSLKNDFTNSRRKNFLLISLLIIMYIAWYYILYTYLIQPFNIADSFSLMGFKGKIVTIFLTLLVAYLFFLALRKKENSNLNWLDWGYYCSFSLFFIFIFYYIHKYQNISTDWNTIRNYRQYIVYSIFFITFFYIILILVKNYKKWNLQSGMKLMLVTASFVFMYIHGMSYIVEEHGTLLSLAILISELLSNKIVFNFFKNFAILIFGLLMSLSIFVQRNNLPYHWWGVNDITSTYTADTKYLDGNLKGIKGEVTTTEKLNFIYKILEENKKQGDTLYTFPHINYFNVMSDLDSPTFAKVHYFDVCNDKTASKDAQTLEENLPSFIIWQDFTEAEWLTHEAIFRNGASCGQRDLQSFYNKVTQDGTYILLANLTLNNSNPIYVWGINDGRDWVNYHLDDYISFCGDSYIANSYVSKGLSVNEGKYTWTEGFEMAMSIHLGKITAPKPIIAKLDLGAVFHDKQKIEIYQGEEKIYSDTLITGENLKFVISNVPKSGEIELLFKFPDAASLSSLNIAKDDRKLAIAIQGVCFSQEDD